MTEYSSIFKVIRFFMRASPRRNRTLLRGAMEAHDDVVVKGRLRKASSSNPYISMVRRCAWWYGIGSTVQVLNKSSLCYLI